MRLQSTFPTLLLFTLHLTGAAAAAASARTTQGALGRYLRQIFGPVYPRFELRYMRQSASTAEDPLLAPKIAAYGTALQAADEELKRAADASITHDTSLSLASAVLDLDAYMGPGYEPRTDYAARLQLLVQYWIAEAGNLASGR
ncbi:MAG: hypothetical protein M1829_000847 [Trizodia sp. TS-e1964]|nr:MAG: hypothetical protein M1829_000847 [Trizodia sp. TS-e1964]